MINIDDVKKLEIKIGTILSAEAVPDADKLIVYSVDLGLKPVSKETGSPDHLSETNGLGEERDIRTILSGVREYFPDFSALVGKQFPVITNLEPRTIRGLVSEGMILYVTGDLENFTTLEPGKKVTPGVSIT